MTRSPSDKTPARGTLADSLSSPPNQPRSKPLDVEPYMPDEPAHGRAIRRNDNTPDGDSPLSKEKGKAVYSKGDIVISTRSWTRLKIEHIDTNPETGETMLTGTCGRSIALSETHPTGASVAENSSPLLVVVHPGSACGSANYSLGRADASATRQELQALLDHWTGGVVIVDGNTSDEVENYLLGNAINRALAHARSNCAMAERIFACDDEIDHWPELVVAHLNSLPRSTNVTLAGAWYTPNPSIKDNDPTVSRGCVNALYAELAKSGMTRITINENASFAIPED